MHNLPWGSVPPGSIDMAVACGPRAAGHRGQRSLSRAAFVIRGISWISQGVSAVYLTVHYPCLIDQTTPEKI